MLSPVIAAYMLSYPGRAAVRESVRSFEATDWGAPITVHVHEGTCTYKQESIAEGALSLLRRALAGPGDYFLLCEDDVLFAPRLRERLEEWAPLRAGVVGMASLYNIGAMGIADWEGAIVDWEAHRRAPDFSGPLVMADARRSSALVVDAEQAVGAQARLYSRACAAHVLREFRPSAWIQDIAMARLAAQCAPLLYHAPSLVQHTGRTSTWGGPFHEAWDFAAA